MEMVQKLRAQSFWKDGLNSRSYQVLLEGQLQDSLTCGLADWIDDLGDNRYRIVDLKVTSSTKISTPRKWLFNAIEMGYVRQGAMYQYLWSQMKGVPIEDIQFCHAVAAYERPGLVSVNLYEFPQVILDQGLADATVLLRGISKGQFTDKENKWSGAIDLGLWDPSLK